MCCRYLSAKSHVAGSAVSLEQAKWIRDSWLEQGLDKAELTNYNVLLSYPPEKNDSQQNRVGTVEILFKIHIERSCDNYCFYRIIAKTGVLDFLFLGSI